MEALQEMARIRLCLDRACEVLSELQGGAGESLARPSAPRLGDPRAREPGRRPSGSAQAEDGAATPQPSADRAPRPVTRRAGRGAAAVPAAGGALLHAERERLAPRVPDAQAGQQPGHGLGAELPAARPPRPVGVPPGGAGAAGEERPPLGERPALPGQGLCSGPPAGRRRERDPPPGCSPPSPPPAQAASLALRSDVAPRAPRESARESRRRLRGAASRAATFLRSWARPPGPHTAPPSAHPALHLPPGANPNPRCAPLNLQRRPAFAPATRTVPATPPPPPAPP